MKDKSLVKIAMMGIASAYCLTAEAAMFDGNEVPLAMQKKNGQEKNTCRGNKSCNGTEKDRSSCGGSRSSCGNGSSCGSNKDDGSQKCGGSDGCSGYMSKSEKEEQEVEYDMAGRRRRILRSQ